MAKQKKIKCPYCGSEDIAEYLYGLYGYDEKMEKDIEAGKIILAGCCIEIPNYDPDYRCRDCDKDFGGNLKRMLVSDDEVLEFAKKNGFEGIKYLGSYEGYHVYDALFNTDPNVILEVGFPQFILVKEDQMDFADDRMIRDIMNYFASEEDDEYDEEEDEQ